jgi:hypothetical protein
LIVPGVRLGRLAVVAQLVLTGLLTALLLGMSHPSLDVVSRPLALALLYATPGVVGALGVVGRRRSFLFAAGIVLVPGSILSFTGVTLIFVLQLALFWAAGVGMGPPARGPSVAAELTELIVLAGLILASGLALFTLSGSGCNDSGSICTSSFLTLKGVGLELALAIAAVGFGAWSVWRRLGSRGDGAFPAEGSE